MRWLYIIACAGVLIWTTTMAVQTMRLGYEQLGLISAIVPIIWVLVCSFGLRWLSALKLTPVVRTIAHTLLVTLALVGTIVGFICGEFAGLGFSYGNNETQIVQAYPFAFGIGLAIALIPGLAVAVIAMFIVILQRARLARQTGATP